MEVSQDYGKCITPRKESAEESSDYTDGSFNTYEGSSESVESSEYEINPENLTGCTIPPYVILNSLGRGAFGNVYRVSRLDDRRQRLALKFLPQERETAEKYLEEVEAFQNLSYWSECSQYVLCLLDHGYYIFDDYESQLHVEGYPLAPVAGYYLVTELMDGNLADLGLQARLLGRSFDSRIWIEIMYQLFCGLEYIHRQDLAHRDIKLENILYRLELPTGQDLPLVEVLQNYDLARRYLRLKYGDLGMTCRLSTSPGDLQEFQCLPQRWLPIYLAPEIIRFHRRSESERRHVLELYLQDIQASDVWALGLALWILFFGIKPGYMLGFGELEDLWERIENLQSEDLQSMFDRAPFKRVFPNSLIRSEVRWILRQMLRLVPQEGLRIATEEAKELVEKLRDYSLYDKRAAPPLHLHTKDVFMSTSPRLSF
jgi:serine/threonine protein kinase